MSGIELAWSVRQAGCSGPIIAMSASPMMTQLASKADEITDAIDKPMDISVLLDCIQQYLSMHE